VPRKIKQVASENLPGAGERAKRGPPKGRRLTQRTKERIRGSIDTQRVIAHLNKFMEGSAHVPTLAATDLTSGGEPIVIERATFKPRS
jgi:hypothetical protein